MSQINTASEFGTLYNYKTGEAIRPATEAEAKESAAAGDSGVILVDGVACYVA